MPVSKTAVFWWVRYQGTTLRLKSKSKKGVAYKALKRLKRRQLVPVDIRLEEIEKQLFIKQA